MPPSICRAAPFAFLSTVTLFGAACASQSPDAPTASPLGMSAEALSPTAVTPPLDLIRRGGSFMFSLDESDPSATFHQQCSRETGGDAAKADACYAHVREVGSHEGMRFAVDAEQRVVMTSFGLEEGKEAIYLEGPLALRTDGDHALLATFAAPPHGIQMAGAPTAWPKKPVHLEFDGDSTLVMTDEVKGRLVYHRAQP